MQKQGEDANDYLRNMVHTNVGFAERDEKLAPLKNFYALVPALSIAHVDHILRGRDKLSKKNNQNSFISDDGFPLGVMFMLRIMGISDNFNSLNWFESCHKKFTADLESTEARLKKKEKNAPSGFDDYEQEAYEEQLSIKRIESTRREFQVLNFNLNCSAILFKEI